MKKTGLHVLLLLVTAAFLFWGAVKLQLLKPQTAAAAPQQPIGYCISTIPREWGAFRGGSAQSGLAFEDGQGTLRFVTNLPCNGAMPEVALEVRRATARN
jgi:hypothetical protein